MERIITVAKKDQTLAIIVKNRFSSDGVEFLTPSEYSQQLAYMHHPCGKK